MTSVIVEVEDGGRTLRATVGALLAQSYCGLVEIILVGGRDDPAWPAVRREIESGQVHAIETDGDRRAAGIEAAAGDVVCVAPAGVIPPGDWVARQVARSYERERFMHGAYQ